MAYDSDVNPRQAMSEIIRQYNENFALIAAGGGAPVGQTRLLETTINIDGTATGVTPIFVAALDTVVDSVLLVVTAITSITANPEVGAGVAAGEDDVCDAKDFSSLTVVSATGQSFTLQANPLSRIVANGETLNLGIDTGAVGVQMTLTAYVYGKTL